MGDDAGHGDVQRLWRDQPSEEVQMSAEEIRGLAEDLERNVSGRNRREYVAAAFVVVWFSVWAWLAQTAVVALGGWLVVLAALWVMFHLHRRGTARRPAGEQDFISGLDFTRSELVRQRDLLRSVWWWYLLPFVPGLLLMFVGYWREGPERGFLLGVGIFEAAVFVGLGLLNQRVARKLQRRIDDLEGMREA